MKPVLFVAPQTEEQNNDDDDESAHREDDDKPQSSTSRKRKIPEVVVDKSKYTKKEATPTKPIIKTFHSLQPNKYGNFILINTFCDAAKDAATKVITQSAQKQKRLLKTEYSMDEQVKR